MEMLVSVPSAADSLLIISAFPLIVGSIDFPTNSEFALFCSPPGGARTQLTVNLEVCVSEDFLSI